MMPPHDTDSPGGRGSPTSVPRRPVRSPLRVLVADDDAEMRALIASALRHDGYDVVEASNGVEVLDLLEPDGSGDVGFDAMISDIRMPGIGGLDLVAELRDSGVAIPILLITAFGDEPTHREAERLGATAVLDKPFELHDLRMAVINLARLK